MTGWDQLLITSIITFAVATALLLRWRSRKRRS